MAAKKLNIISSITRHDILNQLMVLGLVALVAETWLSVRLVRRASSNQVPHTLTSGGPSVANSVPGR